MFGINYVLRTLQVSPRTTREHGLYFLSLRTVCAEIKKVFFVWCFSSFRREDQLADVSLMLKALSNTKIGFNNALTMHVYLKRAKFGIYLVYWTQMTWNKRTTNMKQYHADFSLNRKQRGLLLNVICVRYTKFWPKISPQNFVCEQNSLHVQFVPSFSTWVSCSTLLPWEFLYENKT